jgi:hypothetical protein
MSWSTPLRAFAVHLLPGVLVHLGLFVLSVVFHASADYMGVEDRTVTDRVLALFEDAIVDQQLSLLSLALGLGALVSAGASALIGLHLRLFTRLPARPGRRFLLMMALVFAQHLALLIDSMHRHPAMYAFAGDQLAPMGPLLDLAVWLPPTLTATLPWLLPGALMAYALAVTMERLARHLAARKPGVRVLLGTLALGLAVGATAALTQGPTRLSPTRIDAARPPNALNVLVLAVDSLRADLLTHHPEVVPHLAALTRRATFFSRAIPTVPRTYPSWASMLTGRYPHHHGIRHMFPVPRPAGQPIIDRGLPELLGKNGYRTGVVSDFAGDVFTRGDWGFHHVDTARFTLASNVALGGLKLHLHLLPWLVEVFDARLFRPELLSLERLADPALIEDAALDFIAEDPDQPWFLVAFFSAGHFPFASPAPYWHAFTDPAYRGRSRFLKQSFGAPLDDAASAAERAHLLGLYKGAIAASDAAIGRLLARLEAAGTLDSTVILVTADHGENLYEHGLGMGHGDHLYGREALEVPLILDYPGNPDRGVRIDHPITLCDVAPTIAGRLGPTLALPLELPPAPSAGLDLVAALGSSTNRPELLAKRPIFGEIDLWFFPPETRRLDGRRIVAVEGFAGFTFDAQTWAIYLDAPHQPHAILAKHRMVIEADRKLLYVPTRDGVRWELYAPLTDPGDLVDLAAKEPTTTARLADTLWAWMLEDPLVERRGDFLVPRLARSR